MKKRERLELYGVTAHTKRQLKKLARANEVPTGLLVESVLRDFIDEPANRRLLAREGR